ncbi:MAG: RimK family alpha-L-glutamate ligase [Candidatus Baldrarchaeota archaeon]
MRIGIVYYLSKRNWIFRELDRAIRENGGEPVYIPIRSITSRLVDVENFTSGRLNLINDVDAVLLRTFGFGTTDQITFRVSFFEHLELCGVPVVNSSYAFRRAKDKYATLYTLKKAGIRVPRTVVTESLGAAIRAARKFDNIVIKPLIGARGLGVIRTDNFDLAYRVLKALYSLGFVLYVQEYIERPNRDIRAFVVGDEVVASMYRYSPPGEWKTNISVGGRAEAIKLEEELEELAIRASKAIGLDYAGVDIIESKEGPMVIEVNAAPSWHGLQKVSKVDIADKIIKHVIKKIKK